MSPKRSVELGPIGEIVRENVARIRRDRRLTAQALSDLLADTSHPIGRGAISDIERGARRVDADDLVALAAALGVSPADLLAASDDRQVSVAGSSAGSVPANVYRDWIHRGSPLGIHPESSASLVATKARLESRIAQYEEIAAQTAKTIESMEAELDEDRDLGRDALIKSLLMNSVSSREQIETDLTKIRAEYARTLRALGELEPEFKEAEHGNRRGVRD